MNQNTQERIEYKKDCKKTVKIKLLEWQKKGLSYTKTGYGSKIPTQYMVKHNNKYKRVYCKIYSNIGTLYIMSKKGYIIIDIS